MVSPDSRLTVTPASVCCAPLNRTPVLKLILRRRNARSSALEQASSSLATSRGRASTIVTSEPKLLKTEANSTPMTPPPSTTTRSGHVVEREGLVAGHDPAADLEAGERARVGPGREHDVAALEPAPAHVDGVGGDEPPVALDDLDLAGLHQTREALVEPADDRVLVLVHARHVDALERGAHPELLALAGVVGDLGGVQQGLRRDAAAVQARAADLVALDHGDREVQLGGAQGGRVPAAAGAEDDDVVHLLAVRRRSDTVAP